MAGQPTKYKKEYNKKAFKLSLLGATDKEVANFFEVDERTINNWKEAEPGFFQSLKEGKENADANVAKRLYKRALGYTYEEVKVKREPTPPALLELLGEEMHTIEVTTTTKHMAPDVAAINIWLKNRRGRVNPEEGQKWADRHEVDHTTGGEKLKTTIIVVDQLTQDNLNELMEGE